MTANPKLEVLPNMQINLHGTLLTIEQVSDDEATVRYPNGAKRQLSVAALGALKLYDRLPNDTALTRPVEGGREVLHVISEEIDRYTVEIVDATGKITPRAVMMHTDLVAWHMGGLAEDLTPRMSSVYNPRPVTPRPPTPEALKFGQQRIDALLDQVAELQAELDRERDARAAAVAEFMRATKEQQVEIARLEVKSAILHAPQQHHILRNTTPAELDDYSRKGWQVAHYQFNEAGTLNVVITRQTPAPTADDTTTARAAAPMPVEAADAAPVEVAEVIAPAPVLEPSLNQVKSVSGTIVSGHRRPLTNNGPARGDTKKIRPLTGEEIFMQALADNLHAPDLRPFTELGAKENV